MGFLFCRAGHAQGGRTCGHRGVGGLGSQKKKSEIQPDLACELLTSIAHVTAHFFFIPTPWGPGEGPKGQIS